MSSDVPRTGKTVRWIHLSDLHLGCRGEELWWREQDEFSKSVREMTQQLGMPDLVLVTGDLSNTGSAAEFQQVDAFLDALIGWLGEVEDAPDPIIIAVPGNHDVNRPEGEKAWSYRVLEDYEQGADDEQIRLVREKLWQERNVSLIEPLFANYQAWFERRILPQLDRPGITVHRSHFPGDLWVEVDLGKRPPLYVVGLNSAWRQYRAGDFRNRIGIPNEQFQAALPLQARSMDALAQRRSLLLLHHPPSWFSSQAGDVFHASIYAPDRFLLCLHGHLHEGRSEASSLFGGTPRYLFQAPSLLGLEHYGARRESRSMGYAWGSLSETGAVRIWPLRRIARGDGSVVFDHDSFFAGNKTEGVECRPAPRLGPRTTPGEELPKTSIDLEAITSAYTRWALDHYGDLNLVGIGGGDVRLRLEEVYVPLRITRWSRLGDKEARNSVQHEAAYRAKVNDIQLDDIFSDPMAPPHAVIFGEAGAGKTTALRQLLHRCLTQGPESLQLAAGTVPILLRLRQLNASDLEKPFSAFLQRELDEATMGKLPQSIAAELWDQGRLLLLLDGLDEIPTDFLQRKVCNWLSRALAAEGGSHVRAVISCRPTGYVRQERASRGASRMFPGDHFLPLEIWPLDADQVRQLVRRWFREAERAVAGFTDQEAQKAAEKLIGALNGSDYGSQQLKVLVGSPLRLTLLCLVVLRGGEMPKRRVAFYDEWLRVLLSKWAEVERDRKPLLDTETALAVLRPLAYALHKEHRDSLSMVELLNHIEERLHELDRSESSFLVFKWLYRESGLLAEFAPQFYGFAHLGLQEYLTALYIADQGDEMLQWISRQTRVKWWREVILLMVGASHRHLFESLLKCLLNQGVLVEQPDFIRACLAEAPEVDLGPLLDPLDPCEDPNLQAAVLRLLLGRTDPQLLERCRPLAKSDNQDVQALAKQLLAEADCRTLAPPSGSSLCLLHHPDNLLQAQELAGQLEQRQVRLWVVGGRGVHDAAVSPEMVLDDVRDVALLVGPGETAPWRSPEILSWLKLFARRPTNVVPVQLPGVGVPPELPQELRVKPWLNLSSGLGPEAIDALLAAFGHPETASPQLESGVQPVAGELFVERETGIRLLWIWGDRVLMGSEVVISNFWLGETPVTNRQFGCFLEATNRQEPRFWRNRKFSSPEQPVVGVTWADAVAFCQWLSEQTKMRVTLPSEAQWEFAARGTDYRNYPWGDEDPDPTRACFSLDFQADQPARVGSFPAGAGPWGTLDLVGNVWEWCLDVWHKEACERRADQEVDPVNTKGDEDFRVVRGGGWHSAVGFLLATFRTGLPADNRSEDVGFRVAVIQDRRC